MAIDLSGEWTISFTTNEQQQTGSILLPGIMTEQGYGMQISIDTPFVSSLHDAFWYEREEFKYGAKETVKVPFLSQSPLFFCGKANYERVITILNEAEWFLKIELTKCRTKAYVDGKLTGTDESLVGPHVLPLGFLKEGSYELMVEVDNTIPPLYRPDAHSITDATLANFNGMVGEISLVTGQELENEVEERRIYAANHVRTVKAEHNRFFVDEKEVYFRSTHFGGDFLQTGYPVFDVDWWKDKLQIIKNWGFNGIRFHSWCPPEAAFTAADEEDIYFLVECGMWNTFSPKEGGKPILEALYKESERILKYFGHHPSFVFFSSSNEPGGDWYGVLRDWVSYAREVDIKLGYEGRRIYTAQSGWYYDVEPSKIDGTDFIYFHRSAYGPYRGGMIRNFYGWKGKDYSVSLEGVQKPVVSHELGQWCVYPDFDVIKKFTGYAKPGNYEIFKENARANGVLKYNKAFTYCSGKNQLRLYKEDIEATRRTEEIKGYELLDLRDYPGQGTAVVGFLDSFWEEKGYAGPRDFREFNEETVLLTRFSKYVFKAGEEYTVPLLISHYKPYDLEAATLSYALIRGTTKFLQGSLHNINITAGSLQTVGEVSLDFAGAFNTGMYVFSLELFDNMGTLLSKNHWELYVVVNPFEEVKNVIYTKDFGVAKENLRKGKRVVYSPMFSQLDYDCPALSMKNVFWNASLGPTWGRSLGIVCDSNHPIFDNFPTTMDGGWQWEDILNHSRAIRMDWEDGNGTIVRSIDDWNRNTALSLVMEGNVGKGKLIVVCANLDGTFEERPAAYTFLQSILKYAASDRFLPKYELDLSSIEERLFPVNRAEQLVENVKVEGAKVCIHEEAMVAPNPNLTFRAESNDYPITITFTLNHPINLEGLLYLAPQTNRENEGFPKDFSLSVMTQEGEKTILSSVMKNTAREQRFLLTKPVKTDAYKVTIYSSYGCVDKYVWEESEVGWNYKFQKKNAIVQIAKLMPICKEECTPSEELFWTKEARTKTKEIEA